MSLEPPGEEAFELSIQFSESDLLSGKSYYSDFTTFKEKIDSIIGNTDSIFREQVCRLIGEKIQLFDAMELVCENTYSAPKKAKNQAA